MADLSSRRPRRRLWLWMIVVGSGIALVAYLFLVWPKAIPSPLPLPNPNGYADLLQAAKEIVGQEPDRDKAAPEEMRRFVEQNGKALELARLGLDRECRVPIREYSEAEISASGQRASQMRQVARLLAAEGQVAENEGRTSDAIRSYLDLLQLGQAIARGGLVTEVLVGLVYEGMSVERLQAIQVKLDAAACRDLAEKLEAIESRREPVTEVLACEHANQEAVIREMGISGILTGPQLRRLARQADAPAQQKAQFVETKLRGLIRTLKERGDESEQPRLRPASP